MAEFNASLQESLITLLTYSNEYGKMVSAMVDPVLFEGDYRVIAERAIHYWQTENESPQWHLDDILGDLIGESGPNSRKAVTYRRIMQSMLVLSEHINAPYIIGRMQKFIRLQKMKSAILESAERLQAEQDKGIEGVEEIWNELLHSRDIFFEPGMRLSDIDKMLSYLKQQRSEFTTGIPHLDKRGIVPARGTVLMLIGGPKAGKSRWLVQLGKMALLQRKKVVHITLEMPEQQALQLYYQSLFSITKRQGPINITHLDIEEDEGRSQVIGVTQDEFVPNFSLDSAIISDELASHVTKLGSRQDNLIIKQFPPRHLTVNGLRAYLDLLEQTENFIPDLLILDYIGIMNTDAKNHRISLGRVMEEFRAVAVERNIAGATVSQSSKHGAQSKMITSADVAEDWSLIGTADTTITFSRTSAEKKYGLARLYVANARSEEDQFGVIITQAYGIGQFCLDSAPLGPDYWDVIERMQKQDKHSDGADEDESNDED